MNLPDTTGLSQDDYEDLLAEQDWTSLTTRLTEFAWRNIARTSWEEAEDIAQDAIKQVYDPRYQRWNPKAQPNFFWFLGHLVNGLISNRRQKNRRNVVVLHDQEDLEEMQPEAIGATDEVLARRQRASLIVAELERRAATDRGCAAVLAAFAREIDAPEEQVEATGLWLKAVYKARYKLRALALEIAQTFDRGTLQ
jgi:DNA-directed RNA polymerase specialized sigma24 family protein